MALLRKFIRNSGGIFNLTFFHVWSAGGHALNSGLMSYFVSHVGGFLSGSRLAAPLTLTSSTPAMHRALHIPDIVYVILEQARISGDRNTLASTAQVSKDFSEVACQLIWHTLTDLESLINLLRE